jgi:serine/threonine-protein kinase
LGRVKELTTTLDRIIAINRNDVNARIARDWVDLMWRADPRPLHSTIESALTADPDIAPTVAKFWMYLALWERDNSSLQRALAALPADGCRDADIPFPRSWCEGVAARANHDATGARQAFAQARAEAETIVQNQPDYAEGLCVLGMIDAALGNKKEAIREGRRAVELLPISKDEMTGTKLNEYLAIIYAWTGEKRLALDELTKLMQISTKQSYGDLRLDPYWDPLRGDPRFEKMVASLASDRRR